MKLFHQQRDETFFVDISELANELADFQSDFLARKFLNQTKARAELFSRFHNIQSVALAF